jgi:hypothetical protein
VQPVRAIDSPVSAPLSISYKCYDTTAGAADVTRSGEFPPELRDSCRTIVA